MRRREFLLGVAAAAWPGALRAQRKATAVIGILGTGSAGAFAPFSPAFREGLSETGSVEGQNVAIEYRWGEGHYDRLPALVADLVSRKVDEIVSGEFSETIVSRGQGAIVRPVVKRSLSSARSLINGDAKYRHLFVVALDRTSPE
jgi:putative ABC transport system substrate-binding protein